MRSRSQSYSLRDGITKHREHPVMQWEDRKELMKKVYIRARYVTDGRREDEGISNGVYCDGACRGHIELGTRTLKASAYSHLQVVVLLGERGFGGLRKNPVNTG